MRKPLIQIQSIGKYYHNGTQIKEALTEISLDIHQGEILGLLGVNGAGKTTLSTIIAGLHPPSSGDIFYNNYL